MNHSMRLSMFDHHMPLKMLVISKTRFVSAITMLRRFKEIKCGIFYFMISEGWNIYKEDDVGKARFMRKDSR